MIVTVLLQVGLTKVFLRAGQMAELDAMRNEVLGQSASKIQRKVRSHQARKNFILVRSSAVNLQAICRGKNTICTLLNYTVHLLGS
jgi:myosin V